MRFQSIKLSWLLGAFVAIFLVFIGLYPQISLRQARGADYQGVYAYNDLDETAYAGYLQALIDGRPRRNNPFTGVDDRLDKPLPESLFSIQFLAPQMAATVARIFGADASTTLIWMAALTALAAALAIYKLTLSLTADALFAGATTLVVLCGGVLAIGEGAISEMLSGWAAYPYFPFLRRYVPAIPFPIFWLLCLAVWNLISSQNTKIRIIYCILAALCFAVLIYSYFYIWTAAAAWLACLGALWVIYRPENWRRDGQALIVLGLLAVCSLVPYIFMLMNRDAAMDNVQLLVYTRMPDLLRRSEILSYASLLIVFLAERCRLISLQNKLTLFVLSLAIAPIVVFNQQIVTGRVLQPIHYEVFIINYVALFAFCLTIFLLWRGTANALPRFSHSTLLVVIVLACVWGLTEARYTTAVISEANVLRDRAKPLSDRLREIAETELFDENNNRLAVLPLDLLQGDDQPGIAPQAVLWARHQHVFAGETWMENKKRFYHFLYFSNFDEKSLKEQLQNSNVVVVISLFGWDRLTGRLSSEAKSLTTEEIETEAQNFENFRLRFDGDQAAQLPFRFVAVQASTNFDFTTIDRWYKRENKEIIGDYILYRVKLKQ